MKIYSMDIQKLFPALFLLPLLNAQTVNIYCSNETYSNIVCPTSSLGIETEIFTETQCARCCREDPSCVAFHYSDSDRKCYFYSMAVFGAISEGICVSASGFLFYVEDGYLNTQHQVTTMVPTQTTIPTLMTGTSQSSTTGTSHSSTTGTSHSSTTGTSHSSTTGTSHSSTTGTSHSTTDTSQSASTTTTGGVLSTTTTDLTGAKPDWTFQLVNGTSSNNGRLEVWYNGASIQVCDYYFNSDDADQVCAALGLSTHGFPIYKSYFGVNPDDTVMQVYECNANHTWCNSAYVLTEECFSTGVECTDSPAFRLSDGQYGYDGRVEINLAGVWGTVCGMGLHSDGTARDLLCKEAGPYVRADVLGFIPGSGPIWLQHVTCDVSDTSILDCLIQQQPSCDHSLDVSLNCS